MFDSELKYAYEKSKFIIIKGPKGTGKSTAITKFLEDNKINYKQINAYYENCANFNLLKQAGFAGVTIDDSIISLKKSLAETKPIVFLNCIDLYDEVLISAIINSIAGINNIKIFITIDSHSSNCETILNKLPQSRTIIDNGYSRVNEYIIKHKVELLESLHISKSSAVQLEKYISACDSFTLLNELCNIIESSNLGDADETISDLMEKAIKKRFDKLPSAEQEVLRTSSVLGEVFDKDRLQTPFGLLCINEALKFLLSEHAIKKVDANIGQYKFEPSLERELIYKSINLSDRDRWNELVGDYYFDCYQRTSKVMEAFDYLAKTVKYYNEITTEYFTVDRLARCFLYIKHCFSYKILDNIVSNAVNCLKQCKNISLMRSYKIQILRLCEKHSLWKESLKILEGTENSRGSTPEEIANIEYIRAICLFNTNREAEALRIFEKYYTITTDCLLKFKISSWLYSIYYDNGDNQKKNKYLKLSLTTIKELPTGNLHVDYEINNFYRKIGMYAEYPQVLKKLNNAITFFEKRGLSIESAKCQHNLGIAYMCNQKYDDALEMFDKAKANFKLSSNLVYPKMGIAAILCLNDRKWQKATEIYLEALNMYSIDNFIKIELYINLASCSYKMRDAINTNKYLEQAKELIKESNDKCYDSYFYQQFIEMFNIMYDLEEGRRDLDKMQSFIVKDEQYEQLINVLIARAEKKANPYEQYTENILADIIDKNIFPHYLLFWE